MHGNPHRLTIRNYRTVQSGYSKNSNDLIDVPSFGGVPGTYFYLACSPLAVMLDKFVRRVVSKMTIDVSKSAPIPINPKMDVSINPIPQWGGALPLPKVGQWNSLCKLLTYSYN